MKLDDALRIAEAFGRKQVVKVESIADAYSRNTF
jgi:hypothetical protein